MTPEPQAGPPTRPGARALGALVFYALALAAFVAPVMSAPTQRIIGGEYSGVWRALWAYQWTLQRLRTDGAWPLDADEFAFPKEGPFSSIAPVNDFLSLAPQLVFDLPTVHNLLVAFHVLLAATGGYALARVLGVRATGALVGGAVFGFNSFLLSYGISSAVVETSTAGWTIWLFVFSIQLIRRPGPLMALGTGLSFTMMGLSSFYWAVIATLLVPIIVLPELVPVLLDRRRRGPMVLWGAAAFLVAAISFFPPATTLLDTYTAQGSVLEDYSERKQELLDPTVMSGLAHDYATVAGYLVPGKDRIAVHQDMDILIQSTYAGWLALLLAVVAVRWRVLHWVVLTAAGALLATGPFLFLSPESFQLTTIWYWTTLRELVAPVRMVTSYVRFSTFGFVGLSVLAAMGAARVVHLIAERVQGPRWLAPGVGLGLAVAVLAEQAVLSPVPVPLPWTTAWIPQASYALADAEGDGAVIDWPQRYPGMSCEISRYFYYQSVHQRPIPYDFAPTSYMPGPIEGNAFFRRLEQLTYGARYQSDAWGEESRYPYRLGALAVNEFGYDYVVLHTMFIEASQRPAVEGFLDAVLRREQTFADGTVLYSFDAPMGWDPDTSALDAQLRSFGIQPDGRSGG